MAVKEFRAVSLLCCSSSYKFKGFCLVATKANPDYHPSTAVLDNGCEHILPKEGFKGLWSVEVSVLLVLFSHCSLLPC